MDKSRLGIHSNQHQHGLSAILGRGQLEQPFLPVAGDSVGDSREFKASRKLHRTQKPVKYLFPLFRLAESTQSLVPAAHDAARPVPRSIIPGVIPRDQSASSIPEPAPVKPPDYSPLTIPQKCIDRKST